MGGQALKNTKTRRYQREEYFELEKDVLHTLRVIYPNRRIEAIPAYVGKESFGDMDILLESNDLHFPVRDVLQSTFAPNEIVNNGKVYSFDYKELQIDLILVPNEIFDSSLIYFSFNDLGNLQGRIYHQMGLKYGHTGLTYALYDDDDSSRVLDVIDVSRDHHKIFALAGYDFNRWRKGFNNLEEIFEFAVDTPYFNYGIFDLENRNHRSRIRDKKRPTYTKFLEWAKDKPTRYEWGDMTDKVVDRKAFLPRINEFFPNFQAKYDAVVAAHEERKHIRSLYNGKVVSELTGLQDKDLGMFMAHLKHTVPQLEDIAARYPRTDFEVLSFETHVKNQLNTYNKNKKEVNHDEHHKRGG